MLTEEDDSGILENAVRYGSVLVPLFDAWPSSAINWATFNPDMSMVTFSFKDGGTKNYPCTMPTWIEYKASSSRGEFYNQHFRQPAQAAAEKPKPSGIAPSPFKKRF